MNSIKETALLGKRTLTAKSLRELPKSETYKLEEILPLAKRALVETREVKDEADVKTGEAIMYLRKCGYKFIEKSIKP